MGFAMRASVKNIVGLINDTRKYWGSFYMAKKPETIFGEKVDADLKKVFGPNIRIFNINQRTIAGDADRFLCIFGHFVALELKSKMGEVAPLQFIKLHEIKRAGGMSFIAYPETWFLVLDELKAAFEHELYRP